MKGDARSRVDPGRHDAPTSVERDDALTTEDRLEFPDYSYIWLIGNRIVNTG